MFDALQNYGGQDTDFSPLDLVGTLAVNGIATKMAANNPSFRIGLYKDKSGEVPAYADVRLLTGIALTAAAAWGYAGGSQGKRLCYDAATGLLNSYVATEECRDSAEKKISKATGASGAKNEHHLLGYDDDMDSDDDLFDADVLGLDIEEEDDELLFAYGW